MQELYGEGLASHTGSESCGRGGEAMNEEWRPGTTGN